MSKPIKSEDGILRDVQQYWGISPIYSEQDNLQAAFAQPAGFTRNNQ
jgi:hypothetical protein